MGIRIHLYIALLILTFIFASCYDNKVNRNSTYAGRDSLSVCDSSTFYDTHHYTIGYNFIVHSDSIQLILQQPEEHVSQLVIDTFCLPHDLQLAVTDIRIIPQDSVDSVWVQLIGEDGQLGWIHETELLDKVTPTDPISQFIMFFSDTHILIAIIIAVLIIAAYIIRTIQKRNAPLVHLRDISSFYPTLLCITVAFSATFYASLQMFGADTWRNFYFHPSLNPFCMPPILGIFISSVWAMLIIGIAAVEDTRHHLPFDDAVLYLFGLCGWCAVLYIIFSISTLYYIGYPLLAIYSWFAIMRYTKHSRQHLVCGNCGKRIRAKGTCPHCGAMND